jgi:hypothetical protein
MKISRAILISAALGSLLAAAACYDRVKTSPHADVAGSVLDRAELAKETVSHWTNFSALTARRVMEEYGPPDEVHADRLVWINNSPWRRTVVSNEQAVGLLAPGAEQDIVEQTADYRVAPNHADMAAAKAAAFDPRVVLNPRRGQLSSRATAEEYNFLRLNLADDVIHGRMRPVEARDSYASIVSFEKSGKTSPYLLGLRFEPEVVPAP